MITVGSVCSGMGALEMGLRLWLGDVLDVRWFAEVDPDASLVLKARWPDVPNLGDFTVPDFDADWVELECGGVPCQGFSAAGRQLGAADPRHLWPDWSRGIEARRPATVVFENVANLVRGKMRPVFDEIVADLLALGYDVRWCVLGACAVGAAHHRHRVFLLACRTRTTPNARRVEVETCGQHEAAYFPSPAARDWRGAGPAGYRCNSPCLPEITLALPLLPTPTAVSYGSNQGGAAGRVGEVRHSLESLARLDLLATPQARDGDARGTGGDAARRQAMGRGSNPGVHKQMDLPTQLQLLPGGGERFGKYAAAVARHAAVMGTLPPEPTEIGPKGGRRLAAAFSEWLMMLPAGHVTDVLPRNPALARCGNGVIPLQAATALRLLFEDLTR